MNFKKKVVFITGASRGIGKAIAKEFKKKSAYVIGTHTGNSKFKKLSCDEWHKFDFTKKDQILDCKELINKVKRSYTY